VLVASGCALALALALLSYVRVSDGGLVYRNPEIWSNEATLGLSTPSEPEWRSQLPPTAQLQPLTALVDQYAAYATSDAVVRSLQKQGLLPRSGTTAKGTALGAAGIAANAVPSPLNGQPTPLLKISGSGASPAAATRLTIRATDAFIEYARSRQDALKIPKNQRVKLRVIKRASEPTLTAPRSKTNFIIILFAGLSATVAAAFIRDNVRRAGERKRAPEAVSTLDPIVREAEPPLLNGSEPVHGAAEHSSRSGRAKVRDSEVPAMSHTRRSARSG
jgi:hypothetical protein